MLRRRGLAGAPSSSAPWHIVDFKCGQADGVIDQILTYALVARDVVGLAVEPTCVGVVVSLAEHPDDGVAEFEITPDDLQDAEERLRHNIATARTRTFDGSGALRPIEAFPMVQNMGQCRGCSFRGLCYPEHIGPGALLTPAAIRAPATR